MFISIRANLACFHVIIPPNPYSTFSVWSPIEKCWVPMVVKCTICYMHSVIVVRYLIKRASVFSGPRINGLWINRSCGFTISRLYNTYRQYLLIIMSISMCMCLSVLYLLYTTTYKYISMSWARSIFTPTLQPWIANAVVIDVFIATSTRRKSVLKAWKYYAHTTSHSVSHFPAPVLRGFIAIFVQGRW